MSSSELDLSVDLQLHEAGSMEAMEMEAASSSCQTLLQPPASNKAEFKPKGILKNSKTSENFRWVNSKGDFKTFYRHAAILRNFLGPEDL